MDNHTTTEPTNETPEQYPVFLQEVIALLADVLQEFALSELDAIVDDPAFFADRFRDWLREVIE